MGPVGTFLMGQKCPKRTEVGTEVVLDGKKGEVSYEKIFNIFSSNVYDSILDS